MFFVQKLQFLKLFFLGNIGQENVLSDILEEKNGFLGYKNKKFTQRKEGNIGRENVFSDILEEINGFLGYKNKKFTQSKNWHISKGVNPWFWSKNGIFLNFFF